MESPTERLHIAALLDENVDEKLCFALRRYGYQALTVREVGRKGRSDEEQLEYAVQHKMALLSHDIADFARLHQRWQKQGRDHEGIILAHTLVFRDLLRKTLRLLDTFTADELINRVAFI